MSFCLSLRPQSVLVRLSSIRPSCWSKSMLRGAWLVDRLPMLWRDEVTVVIFCEWRQWEFRWVMEVDREEETNLCLIFNINGTVCLEQIICSPHFALWLTLSYLWWTCQPHTNVSTAEKLSLPWKASGHISHRANLVVMHYGASPKNGHLQKRVRTKIRRSATHQSRWIKTNLFYLILCKLM